MNKLNLLVLESLGLYFEGINKAMVRGGAIGAGLGVADALKSTNTAKKFLAREDTPGSFTMYSTPNGIYTNGADLGHVLKNELIGSTTKLGAIGAGVGAAAYGAHKLYKHFKNKK
jgi:hypothetical protein